MFPVYGLAEASLAVAFPEPGSSYRYITVDRRSLGVGRSRRGCVDRGRSRSPLKLMCVGPADPVHERQARRRHRRRPLPPDTVGHLLIAATTSRAGYYQNPEANAAAITADGWLRTGDLALEHDGELYVTGRSKEIIFVNGQNYYPHDLEAVLQAEPGLELGKVAAAGCARPGCAPSDELVLFVLHRGDIADFMPLATRAVHLVNEHAGVEVARVVPVKRIPKTTSGKLQRTALARGLRGRRVRGGDRGVRPRLGRDRTATAARRRAGSSSN